MHSVCRRSSGLPSIGGKDSQSGTFGHLNVPPTLIAFAVTTLNATKAVSPEFKQPLDSLHLVSPRVRANGMPDSESVTRVFEAVHKAIDEGKVRAAWAIGRGGVAEAVAKMSFGNNLGAEINLPNDHLLFDTLYGSILIEADDSSILGIEDAMYIGKTIIEPTVSFNGEKFTIAELREQNRKRFATVFADRTEVRGTATLRRQRRARRQPNIPARPWSIPWCSCPCSPAPTATTTWPRPSSAREPRHAPWCSAT